MDDTIIYILQRAGVRPDGRSIHGGRKVTLNVGRLVGFHGRIVNSCVSLFE